MKKRPVLRGFLILGVVLGLFVVAVIAISLIFRRQAPTPIAFGDRIGVVEVLGVISDPQETVKWLKTFREDGSTKAIVIRIDSPGGAVGAAQEIYREVLRTRSCKKVVASLGNVAASGGYYIACGADKVVANPGTLTGSIGVVMHFASLEELFRKLGIKGYVIKSGPYKDVGSPWRGMTSKERALIQEVIDNVHEQFVRAVAEGRKLPLEKVKEIADGRILSGEQALQLGLVDRLGSFEDAVELAKDLAGIKGKVHLVYGREKPSLLQYLIEGLWRKGWKEISRGLAGLSYLWYL